MIRSPECIPKCMQAELVGTPEYSCTVACEIALVRGRERQADRPDWMPPLVNEETQQAERALRAICPVHGIPDCSPLLNGCSILTRGDQMDEYQTQVGRGDRVLAEVAFEDLEKVAAALWRETSLHPPGASCECPAFEAVATLQELGYRLVHLRVAGSADAESVGEDP